MAYISKDGKWLAYRDATQEILEYDNFQISNKSINLNGFGSMIRMMPKCFMLKVLRVLSLCVGVESFGKVLRLLVGKNPILITWYPRFYVIWAKRWSQFNSFSENCSKITYVCYLINLAKKVWKYFCLWGNKLAKLNAVGFSIGILIAISTLFILALQITLGNCRAFYCKP